MKPRFTRLLACLSRLVANQFAILIQTLLKPDDQAMISSKERHDFLNAMSIWNRLDEVEQYLLEHHPDLARELLPPKSSEISFPFINQQETRQNILTLNAQYCLLDAPAGYGKSALLRELCGDFQAEGWRYIFVSAENHKTIEQLLKTILADIGEPITAFQGIPYERLVARLAGALKQEQKHDRDSTTRGVVLMIDLGPYPSPQIAGKLVDFIQQMHVNLRTHEFFKSREQRFRVIIAGRYLKMRNEISGLRLKLVQLPPFRYADLLDFLDTYLSNMYIEDVKQITAHMLYLSGGHPGCIAALIEAYAKDTPPPDFFLATYKDDEIVREIGRIRSDLPEDVRDIMDVISLCRRFNLKILHRLICDGIIQYDSGDASDLEDRLLSSYLVGREGGFLQDGITRRLLALRFLRERPQECMVIRSKLKDIYYDLLISDHRHSESVILELLYQEIHLMYYHEECQEGKNQQHMIDAFFPKLEDYLGTMISGREYPRESIDILINSLENDWEFQFVLNYFLRQEMYNEYPYERLRERLVELRDQL